MNSMMCSQHCFLQFLRLKRSMAARRFRFFIPGDSFGARDSFSLLSLGLLPRPIPGGALAKNQVAFFRSMRSPWLSAIYPFSFLYFKSLDSLFIREQRLCTNRSADRMRKSKHSKSKSYLLFVYFLGQNITLDSHDWRDAAESELIPAGIPRSLWSL